MGAHHHIDTESLNCWNVKGRGIPAERWNWEEVRKLHEAADLPFVEVHVDCALSVAENRDPKGLYKKARAGKIKNFTGIDDPYEAPDNPEIHLRTDEMTLQQEVDAIINYLISHEIIRKEYFTRASDSVAATG